ncbi:MAG: hypothetical protein ACI808_002788 [Paraglaciecola sp.]|jgi:hypothetical protein
MKNLSKPVTSQAHPVSHQTHWHWLNALSGEYVFAYMAVSNEREHGAEAST